MTFAPTEWMRLSPDALKQLLIQRSVVHPGIAEIQQLAGDASTRCYFRLIPGLATKYSAAGTLMIMQLEEPQEADLDWLQIQAYLENLGLAVPKVYDYFKDEGVLILEDLGDLTLEEYLNSDNQDRRGLWYDRAIDLLAALQSRATIPETPAFERRFDVAKLMWEFDFMLEHYAEGLMERNLPESLRRKLHEEMSSLCEQLEAITPCYCHRDYHSRNLMVRNEDLVMIDFQDARLGPPQYDLASLLRDTYCPLPDTMVMEKKDRFIKKKEELEDCTIDRDEFEKGFDLMAIQRGLKAVGTFAYQKTVKGNPRYEQYIAPSLANVKHSLGQHAELAELKKTLEEALPALQQTSRLS